MDKEIWIDDKKYVAELWYTWKTTRLGIPVRRKILAAEMSIKPNRAQSVEEIADRLEKIRTVHKLRRQHKRLIWKQCFQITSR